MAQLMRVCKPEMCGIGIRNYATQRYQPNHYETLNVPCNASQKDIKRAFIKLSKQLHPDISGKCSHSDFVKLNEAYSILGKESTRHRYDMDMKYKYNLSGTHGNTQNMRYKSQWEYEVRMAGGPWPPPKQKPNTHLGLIVALTFFGLGILQFVCYTIKMKEIQLLHKVKLESEYNKMRHMAQAKSDIKFSPITSIDENLSEDDSKYKGKSCKT